MKVLVIFGTRPEAIKLCPLVRHLREIRGAEVRVCATAQHRSMLDQMLEVFQVRPDHDLDLMEPGQTLPHLTSRLCTGIAGVIRDEQPDVAIVQGDTTTTMVGALAAFYEHVPVAHVEAGLRTGDPEQPFPEEMNRRLTARLASLHFAPTVRAAENLLREGVQEDSIFVTGNTGIDAVLHVARALQSGELTAPISVATTAGKKLVVVTAHRRENFGPPFDRICRAIRRIAQRADVEVVYPVHRNPQVAEPAHHALGSLANVQLVEPLDYISFVGLMSRAHLLLTDSGGMQEEGPSLGKPVLVMREKTERPEAVAAGTVKLVGTDQAAIVRETSRLLDDAGEYSRMSRLHNPYGDGHACERIGDALRRKFARATAFAAASL